MVNSFRNGQRPRFLSPLEFRPTAIENIGPKTLSEEAHSSLASGPFPEAYDRFLAGSVLELANSSEGNRKFRLTDDLRRDRNRVYDLVILLILRTGGAQMKRRSVAVFALAALILLGTSNRVKPASAGSLAQTAAGDSAPRYMSAKFEDLKWEKILPAFGGDSPEIAILRVDPKTQATQLLIRNPKKIHVTKHWHSANETHTILRGNMVFECDGKREELGPGSFNYIPKKMIHQAWLPDDGLVFITVDGAWDINWVDGPPQPSANK